MGYNLEKLRFVFEIIAFRSKMRKHFVLRIINTSIMQNLNRIKIVLVEQNKTGKWLADQLGKSTCTVSKWCQNTIQPDLKTLNEIANFLKVDVKDLLVSNI